MGEGGQKLKRKQKNYGHTEEIWKWETEWGKNSTDAPRKSFMD